MDRVEEVRDHVWRRSANWVQSIVSDQVWRDVGLGTWSLVWSQVGDQVGRQVRREMREMRRESSRGHHGRS